MQRSASPPSLRDGLRPDQIAAFKRTAINTVIDAGCKLSMDQMAVYASIFFLHKFYAVKSLVRNDPFLMSVACLYLGGKVEDSPKSVRDVLMVSCELRYGIDAARRVMADKALYESLREKVFTAERALLYALDFKFNVEHAYQPLLTLLTNEPLKTYREQLKLRDSTKEGHLNQFAVNFVNDSIRTEACLCYSGTQIAVACIWLTMKLLKQDTHITTEDGQLWWVAQGVQEEHLLGVETILQELYAPDLVSAYSNGDLVVQSAKLLPPDQAQAAAMEQRQAAAQQAAAAAALPPDIAAANRESWAAGVAAAARGGAPPAPTPPPPAEPPAPPAPPAAAGKKQAAAAGENEYDDLFADHWKE